jgi:hypothetical protein
MPFLDRFRSGGEQQAAVEQQSHQKPETAKEMYTREAVRDQANRIAPTADQEQRAQKIGDEMRKATQPSQEPMPTAASAPDDRGSNAARLQNQNSQNKEQKALSPTDDAAGKTAVQEKQQAPQNIQQRPQTIARPTPSWER